MTPLNDDQLNEILNRAKATAPGPSPSLADRVMRAYDARFAPTVPWWHRLRTPIAALVFIGIGVFADRTVLAAHARFSPRPSDPVIEERVVYKDCPVPSQGPGLTFNELQPVREIKPRVVRSMQDDQ